MLFLPKRVQDSVRRLQTSGLGDLEHVPFLLSLGGLPLVSHHISKVCPVCPAQCYTSGSSSSQSRSGLFQDFCPGYKSVLLCSSTYPILKLGGEKNGVGLFCDLLWVHWLICSCDSEISISTSLMKRLRLREDGNFTTLQSVGWKFRSQIQVP